MKKVNMKDAAKVVGGGSKAVCTVQYYSDGSECYSVSTCLDKNGNVVSTTKTLVPGANCSVSA